MAAQICEVELTLQLLNREHIKDSNDSLTAKPIKQHTVATGCRDVFLSLKFRL